MPARAPGWAGDLGEEVSDPTQSGAGGSEPRRAVPIGGGSLPYFPINGANGRGSKTTRIRSIFPFVT